VNYRELIVALCVAEERRRVVGLFPRPAERAQARLQPQLFRRPLFVSFCLIGLACLIGCSGPYAHNQAANEKTKLTRARSIIEKYRRECRGRHAPAVEEARGWFTEDLANPMDAVSALAEGLNDPDPEFRQDAAYCLGYLGDVAARAALAGALADDEWRVRMAACCALKWIGPGEQAEAVLARLRLADPFVRVRVAAAEALDSNDDDTVAAFRAGLVDHDAALRERCESALERLGKLALPLPEEVYVEVGRQDYERWLRDGKVERQATKDGVVYFEAVEIDGAPIAPGVVCALGVERRWCRAPAK
jgi:hypothetical protein